MKWRLNAHPLLSSPWLLCPACPLLKFAQSQSQIRRAVVSTLSRYPRNHPRLHHCHLQLRFSIFYAFPVFCCFELNTNPFTGKGTLAGNKAKLGPVVHYEDKVDDDNDADDGDDDKGSATCVSLSPSRSRGPVAPARSPTPHYLWRGGVLKTSQRRKVLSLVQLICWNWLFWHVWICLRGLEWLKRSSIFPWKSSQPPKIL